MPGNNNDTSQSHANTVSSGNSYLLSHYLSYSYFSSQHRCFLAAISTNDEPTSYTQAIKDTRWQEAMKNELEALEQNKTWTLEKLPPGKRAVGWKWVYQIKYKFDRTIEWYKARLIAKGYTQVCRGLDYTETFAPVAKLNTICVLLSIAANQDWPLFQLDVKNAFLNSDLNEEVYMDIPPGFKFEQTKGKVYRLKKALYCLTQFPRAWFKRVTRVLKLEKYSQS